jgi:hypothetical protein
MEDFRTYHVEVHGHMNESSLILGSPLPVRVERLDCASTLLEVRTDQSGLIGVLRYLHARGVDLLAVRCEMSPLPGNGKGR